MKYINYGRGKGSMSIVTKKHGGALGALVARGFFYGACSALLALLAWVFIALFFLSFCKIGIEC